MQQNEIGPGSAVNFDSEDGPQTGIVHEIKTNIGNGAKVALVRVEGTLDGQPWHVPVNDLTHAEAA